MNIYFSDNKTTKNISIRSKEEKVSIQFGEKNAKLIENNHFGDNTTLTTKYNLITWLPKSLLIQFKRLANIYFLVISILSCLSFSPLNPSSMIGTFVFVLLVSMIKDGVEDYQRYKQDTISNNRLTKKLFNMKWIEVKCSSLKPGDIVKVLKDEELGSDIIIIQISNPIGYCYIDSKNLDGETNLKEKACIEEFKNIKESDLSHIEGEIICDKPNEVITNWDGIIRWDSKEIFGSIKNLILKGCVLRNTDFIIGLIIYVGKNTKIMKNSKQPKIKFSNIFIKMNYILYTVFIFEILICIVFSLLNIYWQKYVGIKKSYLDLKFSALKNSFISEFIRGFLVFLVSYSQMIPISLYVGLEFVKMIQGFLIYYDAEIYDSFINKPSICHSTDLIEELGQVEFIFSDKTGTLTQNNMILKKCYVGEKFYGSDTNEFELENFTLYGDPVPSKKLRSLEQKDLIEKEKLELFFTLLSICHSVFREQKEEGNIVFQGSSPDDIALVKGSKQVGIEFYGKEFTDIKIYNKLSNKLMIFEFLEEFPFDSDRKRMSVIVIDKQTNDYIIFCKGADSVLLSRLKCETKALEDYTRVIKSFSKQGLRVLVTARRIMTKKEFLEWQIEYKQKKRKGEINLNTLYEKLEQNFEFIGLSAIEDKLQEGVADTIYTLLTCNIKIWVLTGDKQDTAEEISKSCRLINEGMIPLYLFDSEDGYSIEDKLRNFYLMYDLPFDKQNLPSQYLKDRMEKILNNPQNINLDDDKELFKHDVSEFSKKIRKKCNKDLTILIDGVTLDLILVDKKLTDNFIYLSIAAKSVICCRVSPNQKAKVVEMTKRYGKWITLSIGDGANDVPMIMEAHIGVGIQGKEGTQAVRSADFAIGQFRYLEKLLLIYGRVGYMKISKFICYYFYKNMIIVFAELFFTFQNGFSGQIYFTEYISSMYNAFFTSWPCVFTFSLENDTELNVVKKFPILYEAGQINYYFNLKVFWSYVLAAIIHGTLSFYIPQLGLDLITGSNGRTFNHWYRSTCSFSMIIHIVTFKLLILSGFWNYLNIFSVIFTIIFYYISLYFMCSDYIAKNLQPEMEGLFEGYSFSLIYFVILMIGPILVILPDFTIKQIIYNMNPSPIDSIRKNLNNPDFKKRKESLVTRKHNFENPIVRKMDLELGMILNKKKISSDHLNHDNNNILNFKDINDLTYKSMIDISKYKNNLKFNEEANASILSLIENKTKNIIENNPNSDFKNNPNLLKTNSITSIIPLNFRSQSIGINLSKSKSLFPINYKMSNIEKDLNYYNFIEVNKDSSKNIKIWNNSIENNENNDGNDKFSNKISENKTIGDKFISNKTINRENFNKIKGEKEFMNNKLNIPDSYEYESSSDDD